MLRVSVLFVGLLIFGSQGAFADDDSTGAVGIGATQCGEVLDALEADPKGEDHITPWIQGFLSGLNTVDFFFDSDPATVDLSRSDGLFRPVINWCRANPLDPIVKGVLALHAELQNKQNSNRSE